MKSFNPDQHVYRSGGIRLPGATDVIKSEGLIDTGYMTEEARWRGKCVHRGIELFVKNELDWDTVDESIIGHLRSFEKLIAVTGFEVVGAEEALFDDAFGCIPDVWGILNGFRVVIELKTGAVPKWAAIQTALQARALRNEGKFDAAKRFGLRLMPDGSLAKLVPFENPADERRALGMVDSFHWKVENGYMREW